MKQVLLLLFIFSFQNVFAQVNLSQGLVMYLPFNGNTLDASGSGNNATNFGATLTADQNGNPNSAYLFNGTTNYMKVNNSIALQLSDFTICAKVKPISFYNGLCFNNVILGKGLNPGAGIGDYALTYTPTLNQNPSNYCFIPDSTHENYRVYIGSNGAANSLSCITPTNAIPYISSNNWDCVVAVYNDVTKTASMYINGGFRYSYTVPNNIGINAENIFIGKQNNPSYEYWSNAIFDEIRIYNRVINQQEIDTLCNFISSTDSITSKFGFQYPNNCDSSSIQFSDSSFAINATINNWEWYFGDGNSSTLQNPVHNYSGGGVFQASLIVTSNTNKKDTFYLQVTSIENAPIVTATANSTSLCVGTPATLTGGGALTYVWTGGVTNGVPFMPNATNTYTVTGSDANGCTATASVMISVGSSFPITISNSAPLLCLNDVATLTASGANFYNWQPTLGLNTTNSATVLANPTTTTTYTVVGTDANGCTGSTSTLVDIAQPINIIVSKSNDIECGKNSAQLLATGASNYQWSPASLVSNPTSNITSTTITQTTTFYVTGTKGTCTDTDSITVEFYNSDGDNTFIPTAFSPNDDNINDCLNVKSAANFLEYYFAIYNRWGQLVFESNNAEICWEGHFNGSPAPMGTYYFFLKAKTSCGDMLKKGDITLMR